jgi:hypothetical protein
VHVHRASKSTPPSTKIAWLFALVGLYVTTAGLFFYGFWHKAVDGDFAIPPPLEEPFDRTFIGTIPGAESTLIIMLFVRTLPPYTSDRWLA